MTNNNTVNYFVLNKNSDEYDSCGFNFVEGEENLLSNELVKHKNLFNLIKKGDLILLSRNDKNNQGILGLAKVIDDNESGKKCLNVSNFKDLFIEYNGKSFRNNNGIVHCYDVKTDKILGEDKKSGYCDNKMGRLGNGLFTIKKEGFEKLCKLGGIDDIEIV